MSRVPFNIHSLHSRDRVSGWVSFCAAVYESVSRWNSSVREHLSLLTLLLLITTSLFSECDFCVSLCVVQCVSVFARADLWSGPRGVMVSGR